MRDRASPRPASPLNRTQNFAGLCDIRDQIIHGPQPAFNQQGD